MSIPDFKNNAAQTAVVMATVDVDGNLIPFGGGRPIQLKSNQSVMVCSTLDPTTGKQIPIAFPAGEGTPVPGEDGAPGTMWRQGEGEGFLWEFSDDGGETWQASENTWKGVATAVITPTGDGSISINALLNALFDVGLISVDKTAVLAELAKIHDVDVTTVPFGTSNTKNAIEAAILLLANALVTGGYTVTIEAGSTYSTSTGAWTGKFKVTNDTSPLNTISDTTIRSITVVIASE